MPLSLRESEDSDALAEVFYDVLPDSGNPRLSFPIVASSPCEAEQWRRRVPPHAFTGAP